MTTDKRSNYREGYYGLYSGQFAAETLMAAIGELNRLLKNYVGRPSPLLHAERLSVRLGVAEIYFKREDLKHTVAHKINKEPSISVDGEAQAHKSLSRRIAREHLLLPTCLSRRDGRKPDQS